MRFINYKWRTEGCFASKYFGIYELHFFGAGFVKRTLFFRSEMVGSNVKEIYHSHLHNFLKKCYC